MLWWFLVKLNHTISQVKIKTMRTKQIKAIINVYKKHLGVGQHNKLKADDRRYLLNHLYTLEMNSYK